MRRNIGLVALVVAIVAFGRCRGDDGPSIQERARVYIEKVDSTPDLTQTDPDGKLPNGGRSHCGPVAVSNSLAWLAENGFGNLAPGLDDRKEAQFEVARLLGTKKYMNTNLQTGTGVGGVVEGLARYIEDRGYEYRFLKYEGWRKHPHRFGSGVAVPELSWMREGLKGNSAVWLNVGWYRYSASTEEYTRIGGHWVTLAGYGLDRKGKEDSSILIIHDPATRAGGNPAHEYVRVKPISSGMLTGKNYGLPCAAKGYYVMGGGMHVKKTADFGISFLV